MGHMGALTLAWRSHRLQREYCPLDNVIAREQDYLNHSKGEYNILPTAGSSLGYQPSEETRKKMSEAARNRTTGTAAANAARSKAVEVKNIETGETVSYASQSQAARELGVSEGAIRKCLKSKKLLNQIWQISNKLSD
jgi:uncharacterized membrane protein